MAARARLRGKQRMYRWMSQNLRTGGQIVSRVNTGVLCGRIDVPQAALQRRRIKHCNAAPKPEADPNDMRARLSDPCGSLMASRDSIKLGSATGERVLPVFIALLPHERTRRAQVRIDTTQLILKGRRIPQFNTTERRTMTGGREVDEILNSALRKAYRERGVGRHHNAGASCEQGSQQARDAFERIDNLELRHSHVFEGNMMTSGALQPFSKPRVFNPSVLGR